jgi:thiol-disulfide isomerase/thioredoxin
LFKKKHLIDVGLVIIILVMGVFVYLQLRRLIGDVRSTIDAETLVEETRVPNTPTPSKEPEDSLDAISAPDFTLTSLDGDPVSLSDFLGKAVIINFWAIWCQPCRVELPVIQSFADRYREDLIVLAVNAGEDYTNVYHFVNEFNYDLVFLLDPSNSLASKYRVQGLPTTYFIDPEGLIQARHVGLLDESLLSEYLGKIGIVE